MPVVNIEERAEDALRIETELQDGAHDPCSELANAHRIREHFSERLLFVEGIGWHVWGPPWKHDPRGANIFPQRLGRIIAEEAAAMAPWVADSSNPEQRKRRQDAMDARFKWASRSETSYVIAAGLKLTEPLLRCSANQLDANPDLLGLPNGVFDLRNDVHRPHHQKDLITRVSGTNFAPEATAPAFEKFLLEIMGGDAELIEYLQRLMGYSLSGHRGEHLLPILWGNGANGKSTLIKVWQSLLGEYAGTASPDLLIQKSGSEHPTALADLQGKRLVCVSETGEAGRLNEEKAKYLSGGDKISARRMRQDFYEFTPTHLLALQTNHRPRATGTDEGLWRRVKLIPFAFTIPPVQRDPNLSEHLQTELAGIFNWAINGWRLYQQHGFSEPKAVHAATAQYRSDSDQLASFLSDACAVSVQCTVTSADLYRTYNDWCVTNGERAMAQRNFGVRLGERGFEANKGTGGSRRWRGIGLLASGVSGASGSDSGLMPMRENFHSAYSEKHQHAPLVPPASSSDAYRRASKGE